MILQKIQRTGAIAGLCAAMAMTVPTVASAAQLPDAATTWTGGPKLAAPMETAAIALPEGTIEVAQTPAQLQRRNRELRQNNRKLRNRNQTQRRAAYNAGRRHGYPPRVYHNNRWYYRRGDRYYDNTGAILATGVIAGAAGLIAGSAIAGASQPTVVYQQPAYAQPYTAEWYRQCDLKYNSFRASDGTYLGYDGYRHTCRLP